jgi:uncharacterized membrane protein
VASLATAFGLTLFAFSRLRLATFKSHIHDLSLISQTLWSTLQGFPFRTSINPEIGYSSNYLGNHFSPGLAAWLPVYALWSSPEALLFTQSFVLALGAWPFYLACRDLMPRGPALAFVALYLLQPALWFAGLYDFHHETACATLGLVAWLCHRRDRPVLLCLTLTFMASLKEHVPLLTAALGVYLALFGGRPRLGTVIATVSVFYFVLVMGWLVPLFNDSPSHSYFARRYPHLGRSAAEALGTCILHPLEVLGFMATPRHALYLAALLGPWMFLPLLAPSLLLVALPILFVNMQSRIEISYDIGFYHADTCLPWISLAAACGYAKLPRLLPRLWKRHGHMLAIPLVLAGIYWHGTAQSAFLPGHRPPLSPFADRLDHAVTAHHRHVAELVDRVPRQASLSIQADLAGFFTNRHGLYPFPHRAGDAQYVLVDLTEPYGHRAEFRLFWLEYSFQAKARAYCEAVHSLFSRPGLVLVHSVDGYLLFSRNRDDAVPVPDPTRQTALAMADARCREWTTWTGRGYGR